MDKLVSPPRLRNEVYKFRTGYTPKVITVIIISASTTVISVEIQGRVGF